MKWDRPKPSRLCRYFSGISMFSHDSGALWYIENTDTWELRPDIDALILEYGCDWSYSSRYDCSNIRECRRLLRRWKRKGSIPLEEVEQITLYSIYKGYDTHFRVGQI